VDELRSDESPPLGWWTISGAQLLDALKRVASGEDPDLVYAELYANSAVESP
jgi:hypothetical protein